MVGIFVFLWGSDLCGLAAERFRVQRIEAAHLTEIEHEQYGVGKNPGRRVCKAHGGKAQLPHQAEGDQHAGNQLGHPGHHGLIGKTHALQAVAEDKNHGQQRIKRADGGQIALHILKDQHLGGADEERRDALAEAVVDQEGRSAVD